MKKNTGNLFIECPFIKFIDKRLNTVNFTTGTLAGREEAEDYSGIKRQLLDQFLWNETQYENTKSKEWRAARLKAASVPDKPGIDRARIRPGDDGSCCEKIRRRRKPRRKQKAPETRG